MDNEGWEPVPEDESGWEEVPEGEAPTTQVAEQPYTPGSKPGEGNPSLIDRIPAANREVLRSIGTGEDMADAYMRGLNNPSKSKTMQEGALEGYYNKFQRDDIETSKTPYRSAAKNTAIEVGGLISSTAGLATDIATNPKEAIAIALAERFPTLVKQVAPGIAARVAEFAQKERSLIPKFGKLSKPGSQDIGAMINEAKTETAEMSNQLFNQQKADLAKTRSAYTTTKNGLDTKISTLDKESIPKAADTTTLALRKKYVPYAKDVSDRFGVDYQKAIAGQKIKTQSLHEALQKTIDDSGMMARGESNWSSSEKKVFDYFKKIEGQLPSMESQTQVVMGPGGPQRVQVPSGKDTLDLSKVDKELQTILSSKAGQQYGSGDHILSTTRENVAGAIGEAAPRVKAVRLKYAPELQAKRELYSITQPFNRSGELDTTRGINFFSNYAQGKMTDPDQLRLIDHIKSSKTLGAELLDDLSTLGRERNTYNINKLKLANEQMGTSNSIKTKYLEADKALAKDAENHQAMLDAMKQVAEAEESGAKFRDSLVRKAIGGVAAATGAGAGYEVYKAIRR